MAANSISNGIPAAVFEFTTKKPWLTSIIVLTVLLAAASGMSRIEVNNEIRTYFPHDDPEHTDLKEIESLFGRGDSVLAVVSAENGKYSANELLLITENLTDNMWRLESVTRVDSITNYVFSSNEQDALNVQSVADRVREGASFDSLLKEILEADDSVLNRLASKDGLTQRIVVEYSFERGKEGKTDAVAAVSALLDEYESQYPGVETYLTGAIVGEVATGSVSARDFVVLTPIKFAGVIILLYLLLGSLRLTGLAVLIVFTSCLATAGVAGWFGLEMNILSGNFYNIVLTVGVAYVVHILKMYNGLVGELTIDASSQSAVRSNAYPVTIATFTTVIGFAALNFTNVPPAEAFGSIAAVGVVVTYALIIILVPALLVILRVPKKSPWVNLGFMRSSRVLYRKHSGFVLAVGLLMVTVSIYGASRNQINDRFSHFISEKYEYRTDTDYVNRNAGGVNTLEFVALAGEGSVLSNPFMGSLSDAVEEISGIKRVVSVVSITNVLNRMNSVINSDTGIAKKPLSELQDNTLSEYFMIYEMSLPEGVEVDNLVTASKNSTRIVVGTDVVDSKKLIALEEEIERILEDKMGSEVRIITASTSTVISRIGYFSVVGGVFGAMAALFLISVLIGILYKSWQIYLMSTCVNIVPVVTGFGIWGLTYSDLGLNLSVSLGIAVGVIVDDTVHIIHHYSKALKNGLDHSAAIEQSMNIVTGAITTSTLVIIAGFVPMLLSDYQVIHDNALMMIYIVVVAFIYDLLVLPAAIVFISQYRESKNVKTVEIRPVTGPL